METFKKSDESIQWNKLVLMNDYNTLLYGRAYKRFLFIKNMPKAVQTSFLIISRVQIKYDGVKIFPK